MKKILKKVGTSIGLYITKEEAKIYNLNIGDVVDLDIKKIYIRKTDNNGANVEVNND